MVYTFFLLLFCFLSISQLSINQLSINQAEALAQGLENKNSIVIKGGNDVRVQTTLFLTADLTRLPPNAKVQELLWEFGDGSFIVQKEKVGHQFQQSGKFSVRLLVRFLAERKSVLEVVEASKEIFVYERSAVLLTDASQNMERIKALENLAEDHLIFLSVLTLQQNPLFKEGDEDILKQNIGFFQDSESIFIWSDDFGLLTILKQLTDQLSFQGKEIVVISEGNTTLIKNLLLGVYSTLTPKRILLTRREAIDEFFTTPKETDISKLVQSRGYDLEVIDRSSLQTDTLFSLPSKGIRWFQEKGIEERALLLVLFFPIIITFMTFFRVVVGFSSVGIRLPTLFTYIFLIFGWGLGVFFISTLTLASYTLRVFFQPLHLLYPAKTGLLLSFLGIITLFILGAAISLFPTSLQPSAILLLTILVLMVNRLGGVDAEKSIFVFIRILLQTIFVAGAATLLFSWGFLQLLLLSHPEIILLCLAALFFMGRFTGLRITEYFRFREVLKRKEEEEE